MAEVLSQSQIDALLNAARSGEMDLAASAEKTTEKKTMSIAERARLASSLEESESEDKTEKPDESETADIASEEKTEE